MAHLRGQGSGSPVPDTRLTFQVRHGIRIDERPYRDIMRSTLETPPGLTLLPALSPPAVDPRGSTYAVLPPPRPDRGSPPSSSGRRRAHRRRRMNSPRFNFTLPDLSQPAVSPAAPNMFRCPICQRVTSPREAGVPVVLQTRAKEYPFRHRAFPGSRRAWAVRKNADGDRTAIRVKRRSRDPEDRRDDRGGTGHEIVREVLVCWQCGRLRNC